jgi:hypothetical protein
VKIERIEIVRNLKIRKSKKSEKPKILRTFDNPSVVMFINEYAMYKMLRSKATEQPMIIRTSLISKTLLNAFLP